MKKVAKMLRSHKELILNWFRAGGELSSGPVEGLNNKAKLAIIRNACKWPYITNLGAWLSHHGPTDSAEEPNK